MDSSTSSIIGALGGGSGVDMIKLASDLSAARFAMQIKQLEQRNELMETRLSSASALKNQLSQLANALGDRIRDGDLSPTASAANPSVASVSVAPGSKTGGTYSLEVTQLAASQTLTSKGFASADTLVGEGTLTLTFGTVQGSGFTADGSTAPVNISVSATDTLATLADKISASNSGVTAYVANTASGAQLVFKGAEGATNGFTVSGTGPSASGTDVLGNPNPANAGNINYLNWSPASDTGQLKTTAQDAKYRFDGIDMTSETNTATGLPGGMTLTLTGTNTGSPTQIKFDPKNEAITTLMKDFVLALNDITGALAETANPLGGELGNDPGARTLKRRLSELASVVVMPNAAAGEPRTLGDLGLALNRDGTFRLDTARLEKALTETPTAAGEMFTTGLYGVYSTIDKLARNLGSSSDPGSLGGSIARYTRMQGDITERLSDIAEKQEALRSQLTKNFTLADKNIAMSNSTLSFLKSQIAVWNAKD